MGTFEKLVRELTEGINGQYPRPWMTDMQNPSSAKVFVVGYNPAKPYRVDLVNYERHIDALFNRNGERCRDFYQEVTEESPSRGVIEAFTAKLALHGVSAVIETNVVCYASGSKSDLRAIEHSGGKERGTAIFRALVEHIQPKAIVVHGVGVCEEFSRVLRLTPRLPSPPKAADQFVHCDLPGGVRVFVIPSLALPGYQNWPPGNSFCNWCDKYLDEIAGRVAVACAA